MSDAEKAEIHKKVDPSEEAAASKLWAVYVSEAEKYDTSLVESWKSDMEGMLIFAGLFSASLTAFIIESYKTLIPDPGDSTVQLLSQISQQLAASTNGSTFQAPAPAQFSPPATSLICNVLWFLSLGLSLSCALIATLLEQWARDFLHRTNMRSAPVTRARIFSYLYYGMKRFNMHTVVEVIPLLLHSSLVFFFAGLVAFLSPINVLIAAVAAGLLVIVVVVYSILTLLPLWSLDCPYRTPLSTTFWKLSKKLMVTWYKQQHGTIESSSTSLSETMVEAMSSQAMIVSPARTTRDHRALVWTVKSLADDIELETFVEGLTRVLWGPNDRQYTYKDYGDLIQELMRNQDLRLLSRIAGLLHDSGLLSVEASRHRQITCNTALWAMTSIETHPEGQDFSLALNRQTSTEQKGVKHYSISARALMEWSTIIWVTNKLVMLAKDLETAVKGGYPLDVQPLQHHLTEYKGWEFPALKSLKLNLHNFQYIDFRPGDEYSSTTVANVTQMVNEFAIRAFHGVFFEYAIQSASLESPPYRWLVTQKTMLPLVSRPFSVFEDDLERALDEVVGSIHMDIWIEPTHQWIDTLIETLCPFWQPDKPTQIPRALIHYINMRKSDKLDALRLIVHRLWSAFPITLSNPPSKRFYVHTDPVQDLEEVMTALWCVASSKPRLRYRPGLRLYQSILEAVTRIGSPESPVTVSVVAMMKTLVIDSLQDFSNPIGHLVLPTQTAIIIPVDSSPMSNSRPFQQALYDRKLEATISLLAEFLDHCSREFMPHRAVETVRSLGNFIYPPRGLVHETHQRRLANGIQRLLNCNNPDGVELVEAIISRCHILDLYADLPDPQRVWSPRHPWIDNSTAREEIKDTLTKYMMLNPVHRTVSTILARLDSLHSSAAD
ncbi:hypothetical protein MVEN_01457800 [Mycena venus]|uniref:DUF6535 domain-containing protein n=1 Tax=Mycena venus TaxID=2733690 RepID=A0A8H6XUY6_9AGAR|nr:hypothetical protein MVEN_01457800 [Mycena venus]